MKTILKIGVLLLCLSVCLATVYGQGRCTMKNIAGSYAFSFTGTSAVIAGVAPDTFHWEALYGPVAGVGVYTIKPDGTLDGQYWVVAGAINLGLNPIPFHANVTINADCTGAYEFYFGESLVKERIVVLGNGREIRTVATQTSIPTGNWLGTSTRIVGSCGQHKVHGDYLFECKNLFEFPFAPPNIFAGAIHIRMLISQGGDYTATVYGKVATDNSEFPAFGHITINDDCTAEGTLATTFLPTVSQAKGVFFDEGEKGYWMPLMNELPDGSTRPQPYGFCTITKVDNN